MTGAAQGPAGTSQEAAFEVVFLDARPELTLPALELLAAGWPEFMQHDPVAERHQARFATELAGFQVLLLDDKDELAALGVAVPFAWDGTLAGLPAGWDAVVTQALKDAAARASQSVPALPAPAPAPVPARPARAVWLRWQRATARASAVSAGAGTASRPSSALTM